MNLRNFLVRVVLLCVASVRPEALRPVSTTAALRCALRAIVSDSQRYH